MTRKRFYMLLALLGMVMAPACNLWAENYISEVKIIVINTSTHSYQTACDSVPEYEVINFDLNKGVKQGSDIYLAYKTTTDKKKAITGFVVMNGQKVYGKSTHDINRLEGNNSPINWKNRNYYLSPYCGDDPWFGDLTRNASGADIVLYYTRDVVAGTPATYVTGITFDENKKDSVGVTNQNSILQDFNERAGGAWIYMRVQNHVHNWKEGNESYTVCDAENGRKVSQKCSLCKDVIESYEKKAHERVNNVCTVCGHSSVDGKYHLSTPTQLRNFAANVNFVNPSANAVLEQDIDYSVITRPNAESERTSESLMIGTSNAPYKGTFDGQNHKITVDMKMDTKTRAAGLFGYTDGANVQKLSVDGTIKNDGDTTGGIIGSANNTTLTNCLSSATLKGKGGSSSYVGGIIGQASGETFVQYSCFVGKIDNNNGISAGIGFGKPNPSDSYTSFTMLSSDGEAYHFGNYAAHPSCTYVHSTQIDLNLKNNIKDCKGFFKYEVADGTLLQFLKPSGTWSQRPTIDAWPVPYPTDTTGCVHFPTERDNNHQATCAQCGKKYKLTSNYLSTSYPDYIEIPYKVGPLTMIEVDMKVYRANTDQDYGFLTLQAQDKETPGEMNIRFDATVPAWLINVDALTSHTDTEQTMGMNLLTRIIYKNGALYYGNAYGGQTITWPYAEKWASDKIILGAGYRIISGPGYVKKELYPAPVEIHQVRIMEAGQVVTSLIPAIQEGISGWFDIVNQTFMPVKSEKVKAYIEDNCEHTYKIHSKSQGVIGYRCAICDKLLPESQQYYAVIKYDGNGGTGSMTDQEIEGDGATLKSNNFSRKLHIFDGWKKKDSDMLFDKEAVLQPSATLCDTIVLQAQWKPGYTVNGQDLQPIKDGKVESIDIVDKGNYQEGFQAATNFTAGKISYTRTGNEQWGTVCLPFAFSSKQVTLYEPKELVNGGNMIRLVEVAETKAGQPVIYKKTSDSPIHFEAENAKVVAAPSKADDAQEMRMVGTFVYDGFDCSDEAHQGQAYYCTQGDIFYHVTNSLTLYPYRAYFCTTGTSEARLQMWTDEETGLQSITLETEPTATYYSLDGKRVERPTKGIYVVKYNNGTTHKLIIK